MNTRRANAGGKHLIRGLIAWSLLILLAGPTLAQTTLSEERQTIRTYPFGDPDPIPSLYQDEGMYPYFRFDGFSHDGELQEWTVVRLENPYIDVTVLPEVGGKVWGGIEKSTGHEFIYKNDVLKFRDIAVRGPWTSGGVEHNFSVYGHAPTTATPVHYLTRQHEDGSASVILGATDWTSRTKWRVRLTVPEDAAYLEIENFWFNPTPLSGLRYHWLNAAAQARDDLQFFFPGDHYIGHGGDAHPWPIDSQGRNLSYYRNNDFGGSKSYHVLGAYTDFYGGYWHDWDVGFGHWGRHADMPGKKVWIWSLARSGAIWEDLLTDDDGQYVEAQAGRQFNQTLGSAGTSFGPRFFPPYVTDTWTETMFPVKATGGMVDAARYGVLNVDHAGDTVEIAVHALEAIDDSLRVVADGEPIHTEAVVLDPMEVVRRRIALPSERSTITVSVGGPALQYTSDESANDLDRPVRTTVAPDNASAEWRFRSGERHHKARRYEQALSTYQEVLAQEPTHSRTLIRVAELYYRRAEYERSIEYAARALELDTYDPGANFIYGIAQRQTGDLVNAKEALGWAARSLEHRSGAYTQRAGIELQEGHFERAAEYARRALDYNANNLSAYEALATGLRHQNRLNEAREVLTQLEEKDPLSHFARFERYLLAPSEEHLTAFTAMIRGEFPHETYLELAVQYANWGRINEALQVLEEAPPDPIAHYWLAYLYREQSSAASRAHLQAALAGSPELVFPFRQETLSVLEWALEQDAASPSDHWKTRYYLGALYWSKHRTQRATELFDACGDTPDFAPFYVARASLQDELPSVSAANASIADDLHRATELDPSEWRAWRALVTHYSATDAYDEALRVARAAYDRFPVNYYIELEHAAMLLENGQYAASARVLDQARVLPHEGAQRGHMLFEQTHALLAIQKMKRENYDEAVYHLERSKAWPEHLGVGRPFSPDQRLQNYMEAHAHRQLGNGSRARAQLRAVAEHTRAHRSAWGVEHYLGALALRELGDEAMGRELLQAWEQAVGSDDLLVQWALASFNGNEQRAQELAQQLDARRSDTSTYGLLRAFLDAQN